MLSHLIAITLTVGSQLASDDATAISYLHLFLSLVVLVCPARHRGLPGISRLPPLGA